MDCALILRKGKRYGASIRALILKDLIAITPGVLLLLTVGCRRIRGDLVTLFTPTYRAEVPEGTNRPSKEGSAVDLVSVAEGFHHPTEILFAPGSARLMLVLEKEGRLVWYDTGTGQRGVLLKLDVLTRSEEGLLGMAFDPGFRKNGLFYLNYVVARSGHDTSVVVAWRCEEPSRFPECRMRQAVEILAVRQPYPNHNAGHIQFGPDGMLYVGWGDGGWRGDPQRNGQNPGTFLGSMLRLDPHAAVREGTGTEEMKRGAPAEEGRTYRVPPDNPFVGRAGFRPEVWAYGFRNPWKFSFDPSGRLIVADVGQDRWEEIDIVRRGGNYGWNVREGRHCYDPPANCETKGFEDPVYEYSHAEGNCITGGYVYTGRRIPALRGYYIFGDYVRGWIRAMPLPPAEGRDGSVPSVEAGVRELLRRPIRISTFGVDGDGEIYVADFESGHIFRLTPSGPALPE